MQTRRFKVSGCRVFMHSFNIIFAIDFNFHPMWNFNSCSDAMFSLFECYQLAPPTTTLAVGDTHFCSGPLAVQLLVVLFDSSCCQTPSLKSRQHLQPLFQKKQQLEQSSVVHLANCDVFSCGIASSVFRAAVLKQDKFQ